MVDGVPALEIADNQLEYQLNAYSLGSKVVRRAGARKLTVVSAGDTITGLATFANGDVHVIVAGLSEDGFAYSDTGVMLSIPKTDRVLTAETRPWSIEQYKDEMFAIRPGEVLQRLDLTSAVDAGISAPAAPSVVEGGSGNVSIGQHYYFVTLLTANGNESPESDSVAITLASEAEVVVTLPASTARGVVRKLWRTLSNDAGQGYLVTTITDTTATAYVDNKSDDELGDPFEYGNMLPPSTPCRMLAQWKHRLWIIDEAAVYASKTGRFETFDQTFEGFDEYSGHVLRGIVPWEQMLVIGTTKKIFGIVQTGVDESGVRFDIETISEEHGTVAGATMKSAEGRLFWFAGDNVYTSVGGKPISITTIKIRKILDRAKANSARWEYATARINTELGWYMLSLSVDSASFNDHLLVYNYKTDTWFVFRYFDEQIAPAAMAEFFDTTYDRVIVAAFGQDIYQLNSGLRDGYDAIQMRLRFKAVQRPGFTSVLRRFEVNCSTIPEVMTVRLFRDGSAESEAINERTVSLNTPQDWKRIALAGQGPQVGAVERIKARSFQCEIEYAGRRELEVNELMFEVDTYEMKRRPS